ncbi:hypothetical protein Gotri_023250 [Gossypium trilobum]|uniref:RNase H type-1 domain-containing protein n=1 Tax=Gossypium trilobum TaxID=34281 RepID=A0A7J9DIG3_9ROSI|nr:hypothetical protein [Gossypium trilobum]
MAHLGLWQGYKGADPIILLRLMGYLGLAESDGVRGKKLTLTRIRTQGQDRETIRETIQFDAAFDTSNFRSASGIVDRDQNAYACLEETKLGINMGLDSVTIMGDSKTVINKCQTTVRDKSIIGAIIKDIQSNKSHFHEIVFMFIQRTENLQAHNLAKDTLKKGEEMYLVRETLNETAPKVRWPQNPN